MKKITYTINFAFIGSNTSSNELEKEIFIEYLKKMAIENNVREKNNINESPLEFLIIFREIPIKIRLFLYKSFENIKFNNEKITNIDVIVFIFNILDFNSLQSFNLESFEEFKKNISFTSRISVLAGIDLEKNNYAESDRISRNQMIEKSKELDVLYTYEIRKNEEDISQFFEKILDDFVLKFYYSSPELFDLAKLYGKELLEKSQ